VPFIFIRFAHGTAVPKALAVTLLLTRPTVLPRDAVCRGMMLKVSVVAQFRYSTGIGASSCQTVAELVITPGASAASLSESFDAGTGNGAIIVPSNVGCIVASAANLP